MSEQTRRELLQKTALVAGALASARLAGRRLAHPAGPQRPDGGRPAHRGGAATPAGGDHVAAAVLVLGQVSKRIGSFEFLEGLVEIFRAKAAAHPFLRLVREQVHRRTRNNNKVRIMDGDAAAVAQGGLAR